MKLQREKHTFPYDRRTDSTRCNVGLGGYESEHLKTFSSHFNYQLSWDLSKEKKNVDTANMQLKF